MPDWGGPDRDEQKDDRVQEMLTDEGLDPQPFQIRVRTPWLKDIIMRPVDAAESS